MQIQFPKINPEYATIKREIQNLLKPVTQKEDKQKGIWLRPYLPVKLCDNMIYQNVLLKTCIEILAEDMVFNDISLIVPENETENQEIMNKVKRFWEENQDEFSNQIIDYLSYGFGASEIVFDTNGEPSRLFQIQADTLYISQERKGNDVKYYAVQQLAGEKNVKMRLAHLEYSDEDMELPLCLWFGGGRKSNFYDYPMWISAYNHVSASNALSMLDAEKISNGNLVSGILTIIRPPTPITAGDADLEETLEEKMEAKGNGVFTLELTSLNPNIPLTVDYVQISETNYNYLNELSQKSDEKILAVFKVPKARLLIDDTTESLNSQKTSTLYKIYSRELNNRQRPIENKMNEFNSTFFEFDGKVNITTPVFVDEKEIQSEMLINLFDKGLITLGQAVNGVSRIFEEYSDYEISDANPLYDERFYNGNPLGLQSPQISGDFDRVGDIIEYLDSE